MDMQSCPPTIKRIKNPMGKQEPKNNLSSKNTTKCENYQKENLLKNSLMI